MATSEQRKVPFAFHLTRVKCGLATHRMVGRMRDRMIAGGLKMTPEIERTLESIGRLGGTEAEAQFLWELGKKISEAQTRVRRRRNTTKVATA